MGNSLTHSLKVNRRKWRDIKSHKKRYCHSQIIISEMLKFLFVIFLHNGLIHSGFNRFVAGPDIDNTEAGWIDSNNSSEVEVPNNASLSYQVFRWMKFIFGVTLIGLSFICWCLSWIFILLSFVWYFKSDVDYHYIVRMEMLLEERTRIENETFNSDNNDDETEALIAFNQRRSAQLAYIDYRIAELEMQNENSDYRRCNTIETAIDLENQSYTNNLVGEAVPTVATYNNVNTVEVDNIQVATVVPQ